MTREWSLRYMSVNCHNLLHYLWMLMTMYLDYEGFITFKNQPVLKTCWKYLCFYSSQLQPTHHLSFLVGKEIFAVSLPLTAISSCCSLFVFCICVFYISLYFILIFTSIDCHFFLPLLIIITLLILTFSVACICVFVFVYFPVFDSQLNFSSFPAVLCIW